MDDYTTLVGANNSGKSTIIRGLNKFFETKSGRATPFDIEDFHQDENGKRCSELCIEITFDGLSEKAQIEFKEYTQTEKLKIKLRAVLGTNGQSVTHKFSGVRFGFESFRKAFELSEERTVAGLNEEFENLRTLFPDLDQGAKASSKSKKIARLREYEAANPALCTEIDSARNMFGAVSPISRIEKYVTWVFVPAVKDASDEAQEGANSLSKLLSYYISTQTELNRKLSEIRVKTLSEISEAYGDHKSAIEEISVTLTDELQKVSTGKVGVEIALGSPEDSIKVSLPAAHAMLNNRNITGHPSKFGHGLQRNFLYAILSAVGKETSPFFDKEHQPTLILAFEEPELFHHPVQESLLSRDLERLSKSSQIITATHSRKFVSAERIESTISCRIVKGETRVIRTTVGEISKTVCKALEMGVTSDDSAIGSLASTLTDSITDLFFSTSVVIVEGIEDKSLISHSIETSKWSRTAIQYGTLVLPVGGKFPMLGVIALAQSLNVPFYVVYDGDIKNKENEDKKQTAKINRALQKIVGVESGSVVDFFESDTAGNTFHAWSQDIKTSCCAATTELQGKLTTAKTKYGSRDHKHPLVIRDALMSCHEEGLEIVPLSNLVEQIFDYFSKELGSE